MRGSAFNRSQRVIGVIGLGLALYSFGTWVTAIGMRGLTGWTGYAPLQSVNPTLAAGGLHPWVRLLIWLVLIGVWTGVSAVLLGEWSSRDKNSGTP
jgi:hypothetical protein